MFPAYHVTGVSSFTIFTAILLDGAVQIRPRLGKLLKQGKTKDEGQSMVTLSHLVTLMNLMNLTSSTTAAETTTPAAPSASMAGGEATTPQKPSLTTLIVNIDLTSNGSFYDAYHYFS